MTQDIHPAAPKPGEPYTYNNGRHIQIVDPDGSVVGDEPSNIPAVVETIIPYFPDDKYKRAYLAYISCGYSRAEALKKCQNRARRDSEYDLVDIDLEHWREDDLFRVLDDAGYGALRDTVANDYFELMTRRQAVQILELDDLVFSAILEKVHSGIPLNTDEKLIYSKRASTYTPESLKKMQDLAKGNNDLGDGKVVDFVALVKGQVRQG